MTIAATSQEDVGPMRFAALRRFMLGAAARNMLWLSVDKAVAVVLGLLIFGLIARTLGPQGAGQFSYAVAVLQTTLGLSLVCSAAAVLPRLCQMSDGMAGRVVANVFVVRMLGSVCAALLAAGYVMFAIEDPQRRLITLVMLAAVPLIEPFQAFATYWQSRNDNRPLFVARGGGLVARLAVVLGAVAFGAPVWVVALAWVLEAAIAALLQMRGIARAQGWPVLARAISGTRMSLYFQYAVRFMGGLLLSHLFLRLDRLWLAEHMPSQEFGLYATSMQLVEVWLQVGLLLAGSIAPAFLYRELQQSRALRSHLPVIVGLGLLGLAGWLGAFLVGPWLLTTVFGPAFAGGQPYLLAGFGAAVLFFIDQFVQISITSTNRPVVLALKWGVACVTAGLTLVLGTPYLGAFAGPAGIAGGIITGWIAVALVPDRKRDRLISGAPTCP